MPTIFRENGYRFFFYSNEGNPREPAHVHIRKGSAEAKVWLEPDIAVSESFGFHASELRVIVSLVEENEVQLIEAWHEYFG